MKNTISKYFLPFCGLLLLSVFLFSCSNSRLTHHKEWGKFFEDNNINGCVMWNNYNQGTFGVYGFGAIQKRLLPAETFHIVLALAGLETGVIKDTSMKIPNAAGDKKVTGLTMAEAFRDNNDTYFQWVSRSIGKSRLKFWTDSTYYGNKQIGNDLSTFWMDRKLKISPDEQLGLMQRLYQGRLAYQNRSVKLVRDLMRKKVSHSDTLYYQQGVGEGKDGTVAWLVGWLKHKDEAYIFSIKSLGQKDTKDMNKKNLNILFNIFKAKNLITQSDRFY